MGKSFPDEGLGLRCKRPDHLMTDRKEYQAQWRAKHREQLNERARARYQLNKDKERERRILFKKKYPEKVIAWDRRNDARPERRARKAELERTEKRKATRRAYKERNPYTEYYRNYEAAYRQRRKELHYEKQANDPQYRLRRTLRSNLKNAIKNKWKGGSAIDNLGCSIDELRSHLESLWQEGMNWSNFGRLSADQSTWQIDHVMPLSSFDLTDPKQVAIACHWTNLAPLWAIDNRRKWNKIVSREEVLNASL